MMQCNTYDIDRDNIIASHVRHNSVNHFWRATVMLYDVLGIVVVCCLSAVRMLYGCIVANGRAYAAIDH